MHRNFVFPKKVVVAFLSFVTLLSISATSPSTLNTYDPALRRYPYLTDVVGSYATINWATNRSEMSGLVRYGKSGVESCTAHFAIPTRVPISVNGVAQYQWKAQLNLEPGTRYCYRVYLGTSPANQIDLLGSDPPPSFWTQVPAGATEPFSFVVIGDWGYVGASGTNPYQADVMSLIAESGARFAVTTGDNAYPDGNQKNYGDLVQTGAGVSAVFGPSFWKVPGKSLPIFLTLGNHDYASLDKRHPFLVNWPQDRAVSTSSGRYVKENYCCLEGTASADYPNAWYAFDAGPARFYMLETSWDEANIGTASEYQLDYAYHWAPGTAQLEWLKADLAAHPSVLKFAFFHYPIYSDNPFESASPYLVGSDKLEGLLKAHGVDIAFTGHAHIYERNLPSPNGLHNYITGGGGAPLGTLGTCTALDAYAIKFTNTGKACGSAPVPTSAAQVYHFLKVSVDGTNVRVTPINSLGQTFDVINHSFTAGAESTAPSQPAGLAVSAASGTQIDLSWSASTDNTGVRGYGIYRDGVLVDTVAKNVLNYSDTNLQPATQYVYQVDAFDGSGNHSALSAARSATTPSKAVYRFASVADAFVAGDTATTNYGGSAFLKADTSPAFQSYLRFHVDDLSGTVTKATLRLYTTSTSGVGYQVKRVNNQGWEEGQITFNNAPAPGATIGSSGSFSLNNWTSIDVTSLVDGNGVYDLAVTTTSTATLNFNSRNASSNRPQLVVETTAAPIVEQGINVSIARRLEGSHLLEKGQAIQESYGGVNKGPVRIKSTTTEKILGSEAVRYSFDGKRVSFSEVMGLPASQVNKVFWLPWYNNKTLNTHLRIANVSASPAKVRVFIGKKEMPGSPFSLAAGASALKRYTGIDKGPVRIVSNQNIVAGQRMIYMINNAPASFSETIAVPNSQVSKTIWFPWYNNKTLSTQLRITNASTSPAKVRVFIGKKEMPGSPFSLGARASIRKSYAGVNRGPVRIVSTENIVASQRVIFNVNGVPTSVSEMMGLPAIQVDNVFWLPWYDNVNMNSQLSIANISGSAANVRVFIGGQEMEGSPFSLAARTSLRQSFAGINAGPVRIVSNRNIVVAKQMIYKTVAGIPTSFSEMLGLPANQLHTTYWLPWYNNVDLSSELRLAVP